jgi:hypothetical protein
MVNIYRNWVGKYKKKGSKKMNEHEKTTKSLLAIDQKTKHLWLQGETSVLYASASQITEIRIIQTVQKLFNIYAKVNLIYRMEDHLLEVKKSASAAKKFVEDFVKDLQKEEYVKNLKGTTFIKKKFILGFSVVETDLVALIVNSPVPVIMASYTSEEDAIEALEHFVTTGTYKTEKIKLDETGLKALDLLVEEISK